MLPTSQQFNNLQRVPKNSAKWPEFLAAHGRAGGTQLSESIRVGEKENIQH